MRERIDLNQLRSLKAQKISLLRYIFGVSLDVVEQGGNNRNFVSTVILPIVGLSAVSLSLAFFPILITAISVGIFAVIAGITSIYTAYKNKQAIEKGQQTLAFEIARLESIMQELLKDYLALRDQKRLNLVSDEFYQTQKGTITEALAILSDSLKGDGNRSDILKNAFGLELDDDLVEELNNYAIPEENEGESESLKQVFVGKMGRVSSPEKMPLGIRALLYGGAFAGGFTLGFGVALAIVATVAAVTFPWIMIPIAAGLAIGGLVLLRQHFVKRKSEEDREKLQVAQTKVERLTSFVKHVQKKCKRDFNINNDIRVYQQSAQEERAKIAVFASEGLEKMQKLQEEAKQLQERAKGELEAAKILKQGVMVYEADLRGRENVLKDKQKELIETKNQVEDEKKKLQEQLQLFEKEKIQFQKEYTYRDKVWKERQEQMDEREKALKEREKSLVDEREQKQGISQNEGKMSSLIIESKTTVGSRFFKKNNGLEAKEQNTSGIIKVETNETTVKNN